MYLPSASASTSILKKRQCYNNAFDDCYDNNSAWSNWGRYVVLGGVILFALALFLTLACITARRRRARGARPYYGTGWMGGHGNVNYYGPGAVQREQPVYGNQQYAQPAPPYTNTGQNQDYYGYRGQDTGIELQQPQTTYQPQTGGQPVYAPPSGPPPREKN